jgi:hypothetical protein
MHPFLYDNLANDPLFGLLSPSDHPLTNSAIFSGGCHSDLSASGIDSLFAGVSITYGNIVQTDDSGGISVLSAIYKARL